MVGGLRPHLSLLPHGTQGGPLEVGAPVGWYRVRPLAVRAHRPSSSFLLRLLLGISRISSGARRARPLSCSCYIDKASLLSLSLSLSPPFSLSLSLSLSLSSLHLPLPLPHPPPLSLSLTLSLCLLLVLSLFLSLSFALFLSRARLSLTLSTGTSDSSELTRQEE